MAKRLGFEEVYPVKGYYERYDPRNTAFGQSLKKTGDRTGGYANEAGKVERMRKELPGFSLVDYSFKDAAQTYTGGEVNTGYYAWTSLGVTHKPDEIEKWEVTPEEASRVVKKAASYYGAVGVGFCELDKRWIYTNTFDGRPIVFEDVEAPYVTDEKAVIPESHRWVVALLVPMEYEENSYAPTTIEVTSNMGYSRMHVLAGTVAEFIRGLGYHAIPCGNDTAISVPIAIQAGLGHMGRMGRLITWDRGPLVRICKVFTNLPLSTSQQAPRGIIEYCEVCKKCADHCPSKSVPDGPRTWKGYSEANNPGALKWYCDEEECLRYWKVVGTGCSICLRVCSFTKPKKLHHRLVKWFIRNVPQLNRFWAWTDDLLGYGKMSDPKKYWDKNPKKAG